MENNFDELIQKALEQFGYKVPEKEVKGLIEKFTKVNKEELLF